MVGENAVQATAVLPPAFECEQGGSGHIHGLRMGQTANNIAR